MNTVNASTGFSPFQLCSGFSPRVLPSFSPASTHAEGKEEQAARDLIERIHLDFLEAIDNLAAVKMVQAHYANVHRGPKITYNVGDEVLLSTVNYWREYMQEEDGHAAKFMPPFDGPFTVLKANPESSSYTLNLPEHMNIHPTFHAALLKPYQKDGVEEFFIEHIVGEWKYRQQKQYLVRWTGYGPEHVLWRPAKELEDTIALDNWERAKTAAKSGTKL
ncbi:hypothetical protein LshimejAT787_0804980 [Lyophyllum shimeji]|uniref:Chromo domain-containing protein n=1 Tax=Lyophyllum shimeji TaxID=47721 RepID=A0A9P3PQ76_LYOSH|nr:hypothetical protein LshimejAT787_0804980 [Lyophyllum shimeji]